MTRSLRLQASTAACTLLAALLALGTACGGNDLGPGEKIDPDGDGDGFTDNQGDCDDTDPDTYPGATDFFGDGVDQDCSGADGVDADRDGYPDRNFGGDDCDDTNAKINPKADEIGWDGIDQNCDGVDLKDYVDIDAGEDHTCAISSVGVIQCWGESSLERLRAPTVGKFVKLAQGQAFGCALDEQGAIHCWGDDTHGQVSDAPSGTGWRFIAAGYNTACAVDDATDLMTCWGLDLDDGWDPLWGLISTAPLDVKINEVALGEEHGCAIADSDGRILCWGMPTEAGQDRTKEPFANTGWRHITLGYDNSCAIGDNRQVDCWGVNTFGQTSPENDPGPYYDIDSFDRHNCAIEHNVDIACWGDDQYGKVSDRPMSGQWKMVTVGKDHSCALSAVGAITCWGRNHVGQLEIP